MVYALSHRLHSSKLERLGLIKVLRSFCQEFAEQHKVTMDFTERNVPRDISQDVSLCFLRILQEGLQNAAKHSRCGEFKVHVEGTPGHMELTIRDTGIGFKVRQASQKRGIGVVSIEERVSLLKGALHIRSKPRGGTVIKVHVPLAGSLIAVI